MAGIYIHIPFCNSKCGYCGFYSLPSLKLKEHFLEALKAEIVGRRDYLASEGMSYRPQQPIDTLALSRFLSVILSPVVVLLPHNERALQHVGLKASGIIWARTASS